MSLSLWPRLQTLFESQNVVAFVFQEAGWAWTFASAVLWMAFSFVAVVSLRQLISFEVGRYVGERISALDRDALGRLVYIFAKAVGF